MLPLLFNVLQTLAVEDRTEVRARAVSGDVVADVETDPQLKYKVEARHDLDAFSVNYSPRVVFTNLAGPDGGVDSRQLDWIHRGGGALQWRLDPRTSLLLAGTLTYGTTSIGTLLIQPRWNGEDRPGSPQPFPKPGIARFEMMASYVSLGVFHQVTPRLSIQPGFIFITYGAPSFEGRKNLPYLENPALKFELNYAMSPRDDFAFEVQPQVNLFTGTQEVTPGKFAELSAPPLYQVYGESRFKHRFAPLVSGEVSGGASVTVQDRSTDPNDLYNIKNGPTAVATNVYPIAELGFIAGFQSGYNSRGKLHIYSRLNPWLNSLTGEVLRRVDNVAALSIGFGRNSVRAQAAFLVVLPNEAQAFHQLVGELGYERKIGDEWAVDLGARVGYQVADLPTPVTTVQPGGYVGLTFRPLPAKF